MRYINPRFTLHYITRHSGVASYWSLGRVRSPSPSISKSESQLSKYCVVCEISWCRCQQLTAFSISKGLLHLSQNY